MLLTTQKKRIINSLRNESKFSLFRRFENSKFGENFSPQKNYDDKPKQSPTVNEERGRMSNKKNRDQTLNNEFIKGNTNGDSIKAIDMQGYAADFSNIFKQLKKINKVYFQRLYNEQQQSTLIDSINTIQSSTQNEISSLKNKVAYLEEMIEKLAKNQGPSNQFYAPPPHYPIYDQFQPQTQYYPPYPYQYPPYNPGFQRPYPGPSETRGMNPELSVQHNNFYYEKKGNNSKFSEAQKSNRL